MILAETKEAHLSFCWGDKHVYKECFLIFLLKLVNLYDVTGESLVEKKAEELFLLSRG